MLLPYRFFSFLFFFCFLSSAFVSSISSPLFLFLFLFLFLIQVVVHCYYKSSKTIVGMPLSIFLPPVDFDIGSRSLVAGLGLFSCFGWVASFLLLFVSSGFPPVDSRGGLQRFFTVLFLLWFLFTF
jgi:hypothetical protein